MEQQARCRTDPQEQARRPDVGVTGIEYWGRGRSRFRPGCPGDDGAQRLTVTVFRRDADGIDSIRGTVVKRNPDARRQAPDEPAGALRSRAHRGCVVRVAGAHVLRRRLDRRGQSGLSLLETLIGVTLSGLLLSPMMAWAAVSMQQQRSIVQRNLSGASLGVLRTVFTRDVVNADRVWVDGVHLADCAVPDEGAETLMVAVTGERHDLRSGTRSRRRRLPSWCAQCPRAGATALLANELVGDVLPGGTDVTCVTDVQVDGSPTPSRRTPRPADRRGPTPPAATGRPGPPLTRRTLVARRVTLRLTTGELEQVALSAALRPRGSLVAPDPPIAAITAAGRGSRPLTVTFDGSGSRDPGAPRSATAGTSATARPPPGFGSATTPGPARSPPPSP